MNSYNDKFQDNLKQVSDNLSVLIQFTCWTYKNARKLWQQTLSKFQFKSSSNKQQNDQMHAVLIITSITITIVHVLIRRLIYKRKNWTN